MISGDVQTRNVFINTEQLDPRPSQKLHNHSPDGFSWGYTGSGPAQLALALLLHFSDEKYARTHYQLFKHDVVAKLSMHLSFRIKSEVVREWIEKHA